MEYILILLAAVLIGLMLNRKLPQSRQFWGKYYWGIFWGLVSYKISFLLRTAFFGCCMI